MAFSSSPHTSGSDLSLSHASGARQTSETDWIDTLTQRLTMTLLDIVYRETKDISVLSPDDDMKMRYEDALRNIISVMPSVQRTMRTTDDYELLLRQVIRDNDVMRFWRSIQNYYTSDAAPSDIPARLRYHSKRAMDIIATRSRGYHPPTRFH